ncbi:MAG: pyridoxamine 5'-phosphate oxidase family protein [Bacteroidia bacterium]|nr:pyridoxamine 5'-phosphate oxidase family protein [Bacteroidia bacterium]
MGDVKNLSQREAIDKIKRLVEDTENCMFSTQLTQVPISSRPMHAQHVDDEGNVWFLSGKDSDKNQHILLDSRVQLFFAHPGKTEFLSIYGRATITEDQAKIENIWSSFAKTWFQEGTDDPNISAIKVSPESGYYWDTKHGTVASLIKIAASVVSGKTMDDGIEGKLDV